MAAAAHRLAFVLTLVVAFVALQTGWSCAYAGACEGDAREPLAAGDEPGDAHGDDHGDEAPCAPTCTDCVGCCPARALLAEQAWTPMASCLTVELDTRVAELAPESEPGRIDRPPRA